MQFSVPSGRTYYAVWRCVDLQQHIGVRSVANYRTSRYLHLLLLAGAINKLRNVFFLISSGVCMDRSRMVPTSAWLYPFTAYIGRVLTLGLPRHFAHPHHAKGGGCRRPHLLPESHTRTILRECFKGDEASQWKRPKFDPRHTKTP